MSIPLLQPMEVEPVLSGFIVDDKSSSETLENDGEVPKTFPGHESLPSVSEIEVIMIIEIKCN